MKSKISTQWHCVPVGLVFLRTGSGIGSERTFPARPWVDTQAKTAAYQQQSNVFNFKLTSGVLSVNESKQANSGLVMTILMC